MFVPQGGGAESQKKFSVTPQIMPHGSCMRGGAPKFVAKVACGGVAMFKDTDPPKATARIDGKLFGFEVGGCPDPSPRGYNGKGFQTTLP